MLKKKLVSILLIIAVIISPYIAYGDVDITSKSAVLMDYNTGKLIYALNEHEKLPPASVTKIMTLLLTMEAISSGKIKLNDKVSISEYASKMGGTQVYLEPGESQTVEDLIKAVSIRSANDAAVALGEFISGSNEVFVKLMNDRAKSLGMENTNFVNTSGLPADDHYTTAYDIALMSRELLKCTEIQKYLTTWMEDLAVGKKKDNTQTMVNTNRLIRDYDGTTGIKTGSTNAAGYCMSASAKRGDLQFIAVILGGKTSAVRFEEAKKLLDYGFANYDSLLLGKKGDVMATLSVEKAKNISLDIVLENDVFALLPKGSNGKVDTELIHPDNVDPPVKQGDLLGEMVVRVDGKEVERANLVAKQDLENADFLTLFTRTIKNFISGR
ncbi:D-alanyl-D-alanine carboxypeptidase family protein [Paratissierella segnis]|uniref:serine-type D-Ala-D-Ala carboxypeptidase n=1 Tax=Paratissierella segnis TaxID=2763679 RepID=A0A926IJV6_9FIRM|nr:D-alanyl-D-alanine carboxypeptidase family protein [Paratissierella segnis]MBC8588404.1 D-alanyl-D-alanine carboxypeptidase [Paratissierella segnis]